MSSIWPVSSPTGAGCGEVAARRGSPAMVATTSATDVPTAAGALFSQSGSLKRTNGPDMMPTLLPASEEAVGASRMKVRSPSLPVQPAGATRLNVGLNVTDEIELGDADDQVFQRVKSKHKSGTVGILTDGLIDRSAYYEHAILLALTPWIRPNLFPDGNS